ncbi:hypothetical protein WEI85_45175 [Actinomycetes bacterium KLBMP 9797]
MPETTTTCPDCGTVVRLDRERLCPTCGYPLAFLRTAPEPAEFGPGRQPGERGDATGVLRTRTDGTGLLPEADMPTPQPGEVVCPRCGEINSMDRIRCQRCGLELRMPMPPPPPPLEPAPPPPSPGMRRWVPLIGALVVAALLVGGAIFLGTRDNPAPGGQNPPGGGPAAAGLVRVDPASIQVTASSTHPERRFAVGNLLDGNPGTVWQSDGRSGSNVGVRLTFRFSGDIQLARITLVNGDGRSAQDYTNNERAARVRLSSGSWSAGWDLRDAVDPQALDIDTGPVSSVTLAVEATYPSTRFPDLAISEVAFDVRP